jgi:alkanesulfonate monooxygenase SsuD/methylene tetrahydromethanopterin reductase-like flavin-dependent oxidoreductase (luciferase family)
MFPTLNLLFHLHHEHEEERPTARAYAEVLALVTEADRLPIGCAWFAEHHLSPTRGRLPAPLLMAVAAARETRRIRVGPCVLVVPLHAPLALAEQIATADVLSKGRLAVGLGSGGNPEEFEGFGIPIAERRERFVEGVTIITGALAGTPFSYEGAQYRVPRVTVVPRPLQPVTDMIWVAAGSTAAAAYAGTSGAHLLLARGVSEANLREQVIAYRQARTAYGLDPSGGRIQVTRGVYVAATDEDAREEATPGMRAYLQRTGRDDDAADVSELARCGDFIVGSPETCLTAIRALAEAVPITDLACDIFLVGMDHALVARSLNLLGRLAS